MALAREMGSIFWTAPGGGNYRKMTRGRSTIEWIFTQVISGDLRSGDLLRQMYRQHRETEHDTGPNADNKSHKNTTLCHVRFHDVVCKCSPCPFCVTKMR